MGLRITTNCHHADQQTPNSAYVNRARPKRFPHRWDREKRKSLISQVLHAYAVPGSAVRRPYALLKSGRSDRIGAVRWLGAGAVSSRTKPSSFRSRGSPRVTVICRTQDRAIVTLSRGKLGSSWQVLPTISIRSQYPISSVLWCRSLSHHHFLPVAKLVWGANLGAKHHLRRVREGDTFNSM